VLDRELLEREGFERLERYRSPLDWQKAAQSCVV